MFFDCHRLRASDPVPVQQFEIEQFFLAPHSDHFSRIDFLESILEPIVIRDVIFSIFKLV